MRSQSKGCGLMVKKEVPTMPRRVSPTSPIKTASPNSLLLYLRVRSRLSQAKLSKLTGVNINIICQCELRGVPLYLENLRRLADLFDVSLDALARSDLSSLADLPPIVQSVIRRRARNAQCEMDPISRMDEDYVAQQEAEKLKATTYEGKVTTNLTSSAKICCDMVSFDPVAHQPIFIKVKSTVTQDGAFSMSRAELGFLRRCVQDNIAYEIHQIYHDAKSSRIKQTVYTAQQILDTFDFEPTAYITCRKEADSI